MPTGNLRKTLCSGLLLVVSMTPAAAQRTLHNNNSAAISTGILLRIIRFEDERRWDDDLRILLAAKDAKVRKRTALAMGRIGDERALPALVDALKEDTEQDVRQMAAFAIGEIESATGADALIAVLEDTREPSAVRARAVEALGKIGAVLLSNSAASGNQSSLPRAEDKQLARVRLTILDVLKFEAGRRSMPDRLTVLLGLTAALRARPEGAGPVIISFLNYSDPRIVADALNTMARLRLKEGSDQVRRLLGNGDPIVRANAARVIGAAEDKGAYDKLLERALNDLDLRVRVSAIRALGALKDPTAAKPLSERALMLMERPGQDKSALMRMESGEPPTEQNEWLEIVTAMGNVLRGNSRVLASLRPPKVAIAFAKMSPNYVTFMDANPFKRPNEQFPQVFFDGWRRASSVAQGLGIIATLKAGEVEGDPAKLKAEAQRILRLLLSDQRLSAMALPDVLTAYSSFNPADAAEVAREHLHASDVIIRATAAEILGTLPSEANARALIEALPVALRDTDLNDAALSILDALAKQKSAPANDAIKTALDSLDHLIRRRAVALLKVNGAGDFSNRIGTVRTRNTEADYRRAIGRISRTVTATLVTSKGAFTIEFLSEDAPLTVDNFVQLARKGYFNGQTVPRVVPNFVIQTGDPRGDQNGGPGYQIRCEINETQYERGAVGMALSGKDTGGSQWFVTHSPQPHLDGGYTVFGRVIRGMEVVYSIARGDTIRRVIVNER
jgi:cyclophilin family peptidyl-prolyl cis-trans isomerase/HEAT repeat protein